MRLKLSLITLTLFSLPAFSATTEADSKTFDSVDQVAVNKSSQYEGLANKISEKLKLFGQGQIQADAARSSYEEKQRVVKELNKIAVESSQPTNNCEKLRNGAKSSTFSEMSRKESQFNSSNTAKNAFLSGDRLDLKAYTDNVKRFCNMQQQSEGLCYFSTSSANLADGDMNTAVLFGTDGEETRGSEYDVAMDAAIQHLTGEDYLAAPYQTVETTDPNGLYVEDVVLDAIPSTAKRYENLRKRHSAIIGLVSDGLYSSANSHGYMPIDITNYDNQEVLRSSEEQYSDPLAGQRPAGGGSGPYVAGSSPIDPKSRPAMVAQYAHSHTTKFSKRFAESGKGKRMGIRAGDGKVATKSFGYCASYVADALIDGGKFNYSRPNSAFQAGSPLEQIGYKKIALNSKPQEGDILVLQGHGVAPSAPNSCSDTGCYHGHIQVYTGIKNAEWVSDFVQNNNRIFGVPHVGYTKPSVGKALYRHSSVLNESPKSE